MIIIRHANPETHLFKFPYGNPYSQLLFNFIFFFSFKILMNSSNINCLYNEKKYLFQFYFDLFIFYLSSYSNLHPVSPTQTGPINLYSLMFTA